MAFPLLAACAVIAVTIFIYVILPLISTVQNERKNGKTLTDAFPLIYKDFNIIFGNILCHPGANEAGLMRNIKNMEKLPRAAVFYFGSLRPVLVLHHPDTVKPVLRTAEGKTSQDFVGYKFLLDWIGDGLLLSKGKKWFRNRRLLTPGFHFDILKPYVKVYNDCAEQLMDNLEKSCSKGESVEVFAPVSLCTLEVILRCAFSSSERVQFQKSSPYVEAVLSMSERIIDRAFKPWFWPDTTYYMTRNGQKFKNGCDLSHSTAMDVITKRRDIINEIGEDSMLAERRYVDFLDILLLAKDADGSPLTDREIRDEVETFMFEGHDTTKSAISFVLYNLARHPEYQERARREVQELLQGRESEEVLWGDLSKMPYVTQCIKESMRLHPPVHLISRRMTEPVIIDGHKLPPNVVVDVNIWSLHHNPSVWGPDHMTYDPERFSEENITQMDSHAFIPFSAGPRNCIGQNFAMNEVKVILARILQRFEMSVDLDHKVELVPSVILATKHGIKLYFKTIGI